jgi:hypothetical protein
MKVFLEGTGTDDCLRTRIDYLMKLLANTAGDRYVSMFCEAADHLDCQTEARAYGCHETGFPLTFRA